MNLHSPVKCAFAPRKIRLHQHYSPKVLGPPGNEWKKNKGISEISIWVICRSISRLASLQFIKDCLRFRVFASSFTTQPSYYFVHFIQYFLLFRLCEIFRHEVIVGHVHKLAACDCSYRVSPNCPTQGPSRCSPGCPCQQPEESPAL